MISYNPKDWVRFLFSFHKTETIRQLFPLLIFISLYSWGVVYLEANYFKLSESSHAKNITVMHSLLGFAISMLLVFRTNTPMTAGGKEENFGVHWSITAVTWQ